MKNIRYLLCSFCLVVCCVSVSAQKLTMGIATGPNFSMIRGDHSTGKWSNQIGATSGIWLNYAFAPAFGLGTEINYTSLSYQYLNYNYPYIWINYLSSSVMPQPVNQRDWDFQFLRFPLYAKLSTPTKLRFDMLLGVYYAILVSPEKENRNSFYSDDYPNNEFGWLAGVGLAYPLTDKIELSVQGRYLAGTKKYIEGSQKNGNFELLLGIGYSFFNRMTIRYPSSSDDTEYRLTMKYRAGTNMSWIKADEGQSSYSPKWGFTTGVAFNYMLGENVGIQTELLYENKGYHLKDSTDSHFRYYPTDSYTNRQHYTDTKTKIPYITIPFMFQFQTNGKFPLFFNPGLYYSGRFKAKTTGSAIEEYRNEGSYTVNVIDVYDNIEQHIKPYDWGWIIGGGIRIPFKNKWKIEIEGRYQQGWTNILELPDNDNTGTRSIKNRAVALFVGLQVPIR